MDNISSLNAEHTWNLPFYHLIWSKYTKSNVKQISKQWSINLEWEHPTMMPNDHQTWLGSDFDEGNSPMMSYEPPFTCSHEITWQTKNENSPLLHSHQTLHSYGYGEGEVQPWCNMTLWPCGQVRLHGKVKA